MSNELIKVLCQDVPCNFITTRNKNYYSVIDTNKEIAWHCLAHRAKRSERADRESGIPGIAGTGTGADHPTGGPMLHQLEGMLQIKGPILRIDV